MSRCHSDSLGMRSTIGLLRRGQHHPHLEQVFGEWGELLGDSVIASAVLDRLLHHSHVLNIRGEIYWLREKRQAGLFPSQHQITAMPEEVGDHYADRQHRWTTTSSGMFFGALDTKTLNSGSTASGNR